MRTALTAAVLLTVALTGAASAHLGDIIYPIYELPTSDLPDLHDGTLEDWEEVLPNTSLDHNDFVTSRGDGFDPSNLSWRVFLAWHHGTQRIYMAVERIDDVYIGLGEESGGETTAALLIDGDHSGGRYYGFLEEDGYSEEQRKRLSYSQAQIYVFRPEPQPGHGDQLVNGPFHAPWATLPPWSDGGGTQYGEDPSYSMTEFYITPFDDLNWEGPELGRRSVLEPGNIIGLEIAVQDNDRPGSVVSDLYRLVLPTFDGGGLYPTMWSENFADGELIPCYRGNCSGATTAVSEDSWGRIKASFR